MASSGKKGKKNKGKTVPLTDFLQETPGAPTLSVKKYNWSDEVEDSLGQYESRPKPAVALPTAPRAARGPDISEDRIPTHPPFIAYISNLPYDIEEEDIDNFFSGLKISNMRIPRDDRSGEGGKLKGFGYVEFQDRASLIDAVSIIDTNLKGRRIKIDVSTSSDTDRRRGGGGGRMDIGRDRPERPEVMMSDWRSGPRDQPSGGSRDRGGGGGGGGYRDRERDGPSDSGKLGAWRDQERPRETNQDRPSFREDRGYRDYDRDRGFKDSDRGYNDRRDRDDRRGGGYGARRYGDRDRDDYDKDRYNRRDDPPPERERSRPKLVLAPRSKPLEEQSPVSSTTEISESSSSTAPAASIFGSAKPVDTSARERQIEERLAREKERPPARDDSREKTREDDEDRAPRKDWSRKRNDEYDDGPRRDSPERRSSSGGPMSRKSDEKKTGPAPRDRDRERERGERDRERGERDRERGERERNEREKGPQRKDEKPRRDEPPARDIHEKEMPKWKEPEPPNFAASNKFATLESDDFSD